MLLKDIKMNQCIQSPIVLVLVDGRDSLSAVGDYRCLLMALAAMLVIIV